jgi:hypothetical protein
VLAGEELQVEIHMTQIVVRGPFFAIVKSSTATRPA